jgi:dipeptidyl aminopeptidase/acylaminoacyl peptidase
MSKRARLIIVSVVVLVILMGGIYLGAGAVIYNRLSATSAQCGTNSDDMENTPSAFSYTNDTLDPTLYYMAEYEEVSFPSRNSPNITISAWFVPVENSADAPVVILVHGLGSCKANERILTAAGMLYHNGFNTLLIDLRDHGSSTVEDGRYAGGTEEYLDALGAWDWLVNEHGFAPELIGLLGQSLGAATVMIAAGQESQVAAVWEDSGFADINQTIEAELARNNYPTFFAPAAVLLGQLLAGDNIGAFSPLESVRQLDGRPIFITHGTGDTRLSVQNAYQLADAVNATGGSVEPWILEDLGHVEAILVFPDEYERRMVEFFGAALAG